MLTIKNTIVEKLLREAVGICVDEYRRLVPKEELGAFVTTDIKDSSRLLPIKDWNKYHDYPSPNALRHFILHAEQNGFKRCIRRVGRRILIREDEFFKWIEERNG